jgi:hypothetical protein
MFVRRCCVNTERTDSRIKPPPDDGPVHCQGLLSPSEQSVSLG